MVRLMAAETSVYRGGPGEAVTGRIVTGAVGVPVASIYLWMAELFEVSIKTLAGRGA